jgi:ethanolamine ammonia-lyase small subunit
MPNSVISSPLQSLRQFTDARLALGRAGTSLPTAAHLDFQLDHARARDAVHRPLNVEEMRAGLRSIGLEPVVVHSAAPDRATYLQRPDLGRRLESASRAYLEQIRSREARCDVSLVVADGLSARAVEQHAVPVLAALNARIGDLALVFGPPILALQGRVALGDEIGALLGASMVIVLIGERPGLSSPDSMGVYLTWAPRIGCSDADRNCISNIRTAGMSHDVAANKLLYLMQGATRLGTSGVALKDETERDGSTLVIPPPAASTRVRIE